MARINPEAKGSEVERWCRKGSKGRNEDEE